MGDHLRDQGGDGFRQGKRRGRGIIRIGAEQAGRVRHRPRHSLRRDALRHEASDGFAEAVEIGAGA
ncbi:hypothetical protein GCM10007890_51760 [Methylobacterium tardum]|uniref:Uncharacterized protein n=1 Tax=Methylobacterium tardum TaxID=374432 RepID=A0AA37TFW8_9HYPH|nr:hypothetical protein GCM10007890_51760 [Methylobacterium tardum]